MVKAKVSKTVNIYWNEKKFKRLRCKKNVQALGGPWQWNFVPNVKLGLCPNVPKKVPKAVQFLPVPNAGSKRN
jgi:hypothetical protein